MSEIRHEETFMLELARATIGGRPSPKLDQARAWSVLGEALRQKLIFLFARYVLTHEPCGLGRLSAVLSDLWHANRQRHSLVAHHARVIQTLLDEKGIPTLVRKGVVYDVLLHRGESIRASSDLDVLIPASLERTAEEELLRAGWLHAAYDPVTRSTKPLRRDVILRHRLSPDHLPRLARALPDSIVPVIELDVATDLLWHGWPEPQYASQLMKHCFSQTYDLNQLGLRTLKPVLQLIDCALHLYREAYFRENMTDSWDVRLGAFMDVALLWKTLSDSERQEFVNLTAEFRIDDPVRWVAHHVDALFDSGLSDALGRRSSPAWHFFLNSYQPAAGKQRPWKGSMRQRLFIEDRSLLESAQLAP